MYKLCWDSSGDSLTAVAKARHEDQKLPVSMRTALMVFGTKPKKASSIKPGDKRRISLLSADFKTLEGLDDKRFRKIRSHCLSDLQYVGGNDRRIHHRISRARDAIHAAGLSKLGIAGIAGMD